MGYLRDLTARAPHHGSACRVYLMGNLTGSFSASLPMMRRGIVRQWSHGDPFNFSDWASTIEIEVRIVSRVRVPVYGK
jgi:hypothetical protein